MQSATKKTYNKPQIEEIARLDRFISAGEQNKFQDNEKFKLANGMWAYFHTSVNMSKL